MRVCPSCGYGNAAALKCAICGRDLAAVPVRLPPLEEKDSGLMLGACLLVLFCGLFFFLYQNFPRSSGEPAEVVDAAAGEDSFNNYDGVVYSLEKMRGLRFLPGADKLRVPPLLLSREERVALAAAATLGEWAREDALAADRRLWFEALLKGARSALPAARRQSALAAGYAAGRGLDTAPYAGEIREVSAGLIAAGDAGLVNAGYFLASMGGLEDFSGAMEKTLLYDPSREDKFYAACSLARLNRPEGHSYLAGLIAGVDPEFRSRAFECLAYSSAAETPAYLAALAGKGGGELAEGAKRTLMLRKQLAIIKK